MVAMAHTTSPRIPSQVEGCRCVSHLIKLGLEKGGEGKEQERESPERQRAKGWLVWTREKQVEY